MKTRRSSIPQRRPVFVGCEGESESGYAALLQQLIRDSNLHIHLIVEDLGIGAGDPLAKIEMAVRKLEQLRKTRGAPRERFALLDADQTENIPERVLAAQRLAARFNIRIVWQRPCFEAVLLRHLPQCATRRPPDTPEAIRALRREWTEYRKPMTRIDLARRINLDAVRRAAVVEPELDGLLRCLELIA